MCVTYDWLPFVLFRFFMTLRRGENKVFVIICIIDLWPYFRFAYFCDGVVT